MYAPTNASTQGPLPIMLFFYGGSWEVSGPPRRPRPRPRSPPPPSLVPAPPRPGTQSMTWMLPLTLHSTLDLGAEQQGSASFIVYNPSVMIRLAQDVIVVTANYRYGCPLLNTPTCPAPT